MAPIETPATGLPRGPLDTAEALARFDRLAPVGQEELLGAWRGSGFASGHPLDGLLEQAHWHGKRFESSEAVHPLVFRGAAGQLRSIDPRWLLPALALMPHLPRPCSVRAARLVRWLGPLLATSRPAARLRTLCHRGVCTAAMLYDHAPIIDVFRRVDADTLLGVMDARGVEQPFFFLLHREAEAAAAGEARSPAPSASPPPRSPGC